MKKGLTFAFYLLATQFFFAQNTFMKSFGGTGNETANSAIVTKDGNFLIVGTTTSSGSGGEDGYLLKVDPDGGEIWSKTIGGGSDDGFSSAIQLSNNDFVITGWTESYGEGGEDVFLMRVDNAGNIILSQSYGGLRRDRGNHLIETPDGNLLIAGHTESYGRGKIDIFVLKIEKDGTPIWTKTFGQAGDDWFTDYGLIINSRGNYLLSGVWSNGVGTDANDGVILELDSFGDIQLLKAYNGTVNDNFNGAVFENNGLIQNIGTSRSWSGTGNQEIWMSDLRITANFNWTKTFGLAGKDIDVGGVVNSVSNTYLISATESRAGQAGNGLLLRVDKGGRVQWAQSYGGTGSDQLQTVIELNSSIYAFGTTRSYGQGLGDIWMIKADTDGNVPGCSTPVANLIITDVSGRTSEPVPAISSPNLGEANSPTVNNVDIEDSFVCKSDNPIADFEASSYVICEGECVDLTNTSEGTILTWEWAFSGANILGSGAWEPTDVCFFTPGVDTMTLIVSNLTGSDTLQKTITILPKPIVDLGADTTICNNQPLVLDAFMVNASYLWSDNSFGQTLNVNSSGTYAVTVTQRFCTASDSIQVSAIELTESLGSDTTICPGGTFLLDASHPDITDYVWQDGSTDPVFNALSTGIYRVEMSNFCGTITDSIELSIIDPLLPADLGADQIVCKGDTLILDATAPGVLFYEWNTGNQEPTNSITAPGDYEVRIADNCAENTDIINVKFERCCEFFIPNAFSPNNDGINDEFQAFFSSEKCKFISSYSLEIFDRWGEPVFLTKDINQGWDGIFRGKIAPAGVYAWVVKYVDGDEGNTEKGDFTIFR